MLSRVCLDLLSLVSLHTLFKKLIFRIWQYSQVPLTVVLGTPDTSGLHILLLTVPQVIREDLYTLLIMCSLRPYGHHRDEDSSGCAHLSG